MGRPTCKPTQTTRPEMKLVAWCALSLALTPARSTMMQPPQARTVPPIYLPEPSERRRLLLRAPPHCQSLQRHARVPRQQWLQRPLARCTQTTASRTARCDTRRHGQNAQAPLRWRPGSPRHQWGHRQWVCRPWVPRQTCHTHMRPANRTPIGCRTTPCRSRKRARAERLLTRPPTCAAHNPQDHRWLLRGRHLLQQQRLRSPAN